MDSNSLNQTDKENASMPYIGLQVEPDAPVFVAPPKPVQPYPQPQSQVYAQPVQPQQVIPQAQVYAQPVQPQQVIPQAQVYAQPVQPQRVIPQAQVYAQAARPQPVQVQPRVQQAYVQPQMYAQQQMYTQPVQPRPYAQPVQPRPSRYIVPPIVVTPREAEKENLTGVEQNIRSVLKSPFMLALSIVALLQLVMSVLSMAPSLFAFLTGFVALPYLGIFVGCILLFIEAKIGKNVKGGIVTLKIMGIIGIIADAFIIHILIIITAAAMIEPADFMDLLEMISYYVFGMRFAVMEFSRLQAAVICILMIVPSVLFPILQGKLFNMYKLINDAYKSQIYKKPNTTGAAVMSFIFSIYLLVLSVVYFIYATRLQAVFSVIATCVFLIASVSFFILQGVLLIFIGRKNV